MITIDHFDLSVITIDHFDLAMITIDHFDLAMITIDHFDLVMTIDCTRKQNLVFGYVSRSKRVALENKVLPTFSF